VRELIACASVTIVLGLAACTGSADDPPSTNLPGLATTPRVSTTTVPRPTSITTTETTVPPVDLPSVGEAYPAVIELACGEMCLNTGAWISVSPSHSDHDLALTVIRLAYPAARIVNTDVADGYPWTGNVLNRSCG